MMTRHVMIAVGLVLIPMAGFAQEPPPRPPTPQPSRAVPLPKAAPPSPERQLIEYFTATRPPMPLQAEKQLLEYSLTTPFPGAAPVWSGFNATPVRQTWYRDDPADSLYRVAHGLFSRHEYRAAAERYSEVRAKHPDSRYFCDAAYYEAFARYRLGTPADLRTASAVLEGSSDRCSDATRRADVPELRSRIDGALARSGDGAAAERVRRTASQGLTVCDREEQNVKIEALSALSQMEPETAAPVLRNVLNSKDECLAPVRRQALGLVARRNDGESVTLLSAAARTDPNRTNQLEAVRALARMNTDASYAAIEAVMRTTTDERLQTEMVSTLARNEQPRAQMIVRTLIDRNDVSPRVRVSAINALATRREVPTEYWRSAYGRMDTDDLRRAVMAALARQNTDEAQQVLLGIARSPAEPTAIRTNAIARVQGTAPLDGIYGLLTSADSRSLRLAIVNALASRNEPEATARLIEIARTNTDPDVRAAAIRALSRSPRREDPRVARALGEIIGCCQ